MNWKRFLHHRYLGTLTTFGFLGWYFVQTGRHGSVIAPLVGAILSLLWVLDDVLYEEKGWKVAGYWIEQLLQKIPAYVKLKGWIESKLGGGNAEE